MFPLQAPAPTVPPMLMALPAPHPLTFKDCVFFSLSHITQLLLGGLVGISLSGILAFYRVE